MAKFGLLNFFKPGHPDKVVTRPEKKKKKNSLIKRK